MLSVTDTDGHIRDTVLRMPFHFGETELTALPHLFLTADVDVDGETVTGIAADCLSPLWFYKDGRSFADGLDAMFDVIEAARERAETLDPASTPFEFWHRLHDVQADWAAGTEYPPLLWGFGVSLVERCVIDAYCRQRDVTFAEALGQGAFGVDPGVVYPELDGVAPADLLPDRPRRSLTMRHTVGFTDPLTDDDVAPDERLDDGLPQTLADYVDEQGLTHFKVKLSGDVAADRDRLAALASFFAGRLDEYAVTLDANEQYPDAPTFADAWRTFRETAGVPPLLDHVLYVEQPLARDEAFADEVAETFDADDLPPVIIDESDARPESLGRALDAGYAGTSHKNCKGVFRSVVNACLLAHRRREDPDGTYVLSAEDLTTVGPVSLQQDLAVVGALGPDHVERNGHHYFEGLDMFPEDIRQRTVAAHPDLYREHERGFPTLDVHDGRFEIGSAVDAPFGHAVDVDPTRFTQMESWTFRER